MHSHEHTLNTYCERGTARRSVGVQRGPDSGPNLAQIAAHNPEPSSHRVPCNAAPRRTRIPALLCASQRNKAGDGCPSPGRISPPPFPPSPITHSSGMLRLGASVGRSVSPRSPRGAGAADARGGGGCTRARWIAALARQALESQAARGGGDVGWGWRRPRPITDPTAPPQCPPPRSSRLGGGRDRRRSASASRAAAALGLQLPTGPATGPGSEREQRARPVNPPTPSWPSQRSFRFPW